MSGPEWTLVVVTSADGFIARSPGDAPHLWASPEEQAIFLAEVERADWSAMGRGTHETSDRPDRRRIVFSASAGEGEWRRPTQLWIDPARVSPDDLAARVGHLHPLRAGLILGGTRVHDWFLAHRAIDRIHLSEEPLRFGAGVPLFSEQRGPAAETLERLGFVRRVVRQLNEGGSRYSVWTPA